jgi:hypothetical protein
MALITSSDSLNTSFTPSAAGDFAPTVANGTAILQRQVASGAPWTPIGAISAGDAVIVNNPVAGIAYRFVAALGTTPLVRADQ